MKILHTSDWHLGQSFFTKTRKDEHHAFIQWLLALISREQIDAVIIAGDVFDTATPASYARELYNEFVVQLQQRQCTLVVLGGNHDSVAVLNESRQLLACLNTYVVASTELSVEQQVILLNDKQGQPGALLCAVPFIRAKDVLQSQAGDTGQQKRQALANAIAEHYQHLFQLAEQQRQEQQLNIPIVATGHLTALGVSKSESVREIYIGTLEGFAAEGFPPADYIALGHIHRPQRVAKTEHIRYSGSPLPLSFDELGTTKQVVLVEFNGRERQQIRCIDVPLFQPMQVIKGDLDTLAVQLAAIAQQQHSKPVWLCLEVATQDYLSDLQQRVQQLCEGLPVEVLLVRRQRAAPSQALIQQQKETLAELTPEQVFAKRLAIESIEDTERQQQLQQRFLAVLSAVQQEQSR
ncbi:exonuclease subunit SbcD [Alishewanella sp. SMS8]|uniref:exonuclease subunit SbcD n=1 Tax=Alishewanella sp. SMS8 TaxID=2994676 RepID=UPI00274239F8|nr:exonuclease subunit SbcD [Alishewanella sp. SMS8]MDP5459140.1 exonuclease subunit SbcD [Alishewanella sp. SMS8]